jgi:hypothetical protein
MLLQLKQSSMKQHHRGAAPRKIFMTQLSLGKIMANIFWGSEGAIHVDFLPHGTTIYVRYHNSMLCDTVHLAICKRRPRKLSQKITVPHDNTQLYTENLTMTTAIIPLVWKIMNHLPYSPDRVSSNFHLLDH